jgi:hypothetical protein
MIIAIIILFLVLAFLGFAKERENNNRLMTIKVRIDDSRIFDRILSENRIIPEYINNSQEYVTYYIKIGSLSKYDVTQMKIQEEDLNAFLRILEYNCIIPDYIRPRTGGGRAQE